jgi:hypothetical protein
VTLPLPTSAFRDEVHGDQHMAPAVLTRPSTARPVGLVVRVLPQLAQHVAHASSGKGRASATWQL